MFYALVASPRSCHDIPIVVLGDGEQVFALLRHGPDPVVDPLLMREPVLAFRVPYTYSGSSVTVIRGRPTPRRGSAVVRRAHPGLGCSLVRA